MIRCCVDGIVKEYAIEIENVDLNKKEVNKGMVIRVTDEKLLEKNGRNCAGDERQPDYPERTDRRSGDSCICAGSHERIRDFY